MPVSQDCKRMLPQTTCFAEFHRHWQLQVALLCVFPTDVYVCMCVYMYCTCMCEHVHVDVCLLLDQFLMIS